MPWETHFLGSGRFSALILSQASPPRTLGPRAAPHTFASSCTCICLSFCIHSRINLDLQCQAPKRSSGFSLFWIIWSLNVKSSNNDTCIYLFIYFPFCQPPQSHDHPVGDTGGSHFSLHWPSPTITPACHLQPWTENRDHDTNQEGNAMDKESGVRGPLLPKDPHGSSELHRDVALEFFFTFKCEIHTHTHI